MKKAALKGFINATDCADYLVKKGLPFRTAYKITGAIVSECISKNTVLDSLPLSEYKKHSELFSEDLYEEISLKTCVKKRISYGSTGYGSVDIQINNINKFLENQKKKGN